MGRGSVLQEQFDWMKPLVGGQNPACYNSMIQRLRRALLALKLWRRHFLRCEALTAFTTNTSSNF